jgi:hypothetical protein
MRFSDQTRDEQLKWFWNQYGIDATIGNRVRYGGTPGVIVDYSGPYLVVRLEEGMAGYKKGTLINCHPTWHMEYLDDQ